MNKKPEKTILYDGQCGLCSSFVDFILRRGGKDTFQLIARETDKGQTILADLPEKIKNADSVIFLDGQKASNRSTAALKILSELGGFYKLTRIFLLIPRFFRDDIYAWVARNRHRWVGKKKNQS